MIISETNSPLNSTAVIIIQLTSNERLLLANMLTGQLLVENNPSFLNKTIPAVLYADKGGREVCVEFHYQTEQIYAGSSVG